MNGTLIESELFRRVTYLHPLEELRVPEKFPIALVAWMLMMFTFHFLCGTLEICDQKKWLVQFRRKPAGDRKTYKEMMPRILINQIFLMLPCMIIAEKLGLCYQSKQVLISVPSLVYNFLVMGIGHDVIFYVGHRYLLHSRWGYKLFGHDVHHSTSANCALSAFYMANVDFCFEILLPYLIPMWLMGPESCVAFSLLAPSIGAVGGLYEHSGYEFFPNLSIASTKAHFMHHNLGFVSFADGFGSPGLMDWTFGTTYEHYQKKNTTPVENGEKSD
ncbi:hypothetical protein NDN08_001546 [Rhodosorus marinus]|uniref:Fatty acid hydroxylase domain-containing protein n=1 Tax=Rhodosorus marinus TaxID=101924 RepID=A0AAV8USJ9_9RHOD|nr:hypothetical protein NDN08_001546 [Rhodosorus marinus]